MTQIEVKLVVQHPTTVAEISKACHISAEVWTLSNPTTRTGGVLKIWVHLHLSQQSVFKCNFKNQCCRQTNYISSVHVAYASSLPINECTKTLY